MRRISPSCMAAVSLIRYPFDTNFDHYNVTVSSDCIYWPGGGDVIMGELVTESSVPIPINIHIAVSTASDLLSYGSMERSSPLRSRPQGCERI